MKLHEYQAKEVFAKHQIKIPRGKFADSPEAVQKAVDALSAEIPELGKVVLKAQVHVGGRGKAGGIKVVDKENAFEMSKELFGKDIKGLTIKKLLVEEAIDIQQEYYVGLTLDRANRKTVLMVSGMGGVDIEEVAKEHPDAIKTALIDPQLGLTDYQIRQVVFGAELPKAAAGFLKKLYEVYEAYDCSIAEINPLIVTGTGDVIAADAKFDADDNAIFKYPDIKAYQDPAEVDPNELEAKSAGLSYVQLDGDIGCVVNGAGLAMATMDAIKLGGGEPANFLDVGGSSNPDKVKTAMKILTSQNVKSILFNIFGGITRCDDIAKGIISAVEDMGGLQVPLVIRLTGTNEELGRQMLTDKGYNVGSSMTEAVKEVIAAAK